LLLIANIGKQQASNGSIGTGSSRPRSRCRSKRLIAKIGDVILVIIDPVSSYMGSGIEGNTITSVRPVLESTADMAERTRVAVLLIHHPPKQPAGGKALNAFSGSLAFVAAPRISFIAVAEENSERKLLLAVKNNLGALMGGLGYFISERYVGQRPSIKTTAIEWDAAPVTLSANEALRRSGRREAPAVVAGAVSRWSGGGERTDRDSAAGRD
jgi:hypothetical protein